MSAAPYRVANDSPAWLTPRRLVFFLVRGYGREATGTDLRDARGRVRTWRTHEAAQRVADRLNARGAA